MPCVVGVAGWGIAIVLRLQCCMWKGSSSNDGVFDVDALCGGDAVRGRYGGVVMGIAWLF